MSTMYEALRKAEAKQGKTADLAAETNSAPDNIKVAFLLVAVIVVFAVAFYRFNKAKQPHSAAVQKNVTTTVAVAQNPSPVSSKPARAPGTYDLEGIIGAGEDSMAIINGKLLKIDGTIDTLILKKISPKEVELLNTKDNSTAVLKIN